MNVIIKGFAALFYRKVDIDYDPLRLNFFTIINPLSISVCCTLLVVILLIIDVPFLDLIELKTYDLRFLSRGSQKTSTAVVLAVIDEKSLDEQGRWPWPRSKIADLVDALNKDGAKVIGFDIGFLEPDQNSNLKLFNQVEDQINDLNMGTIVALGRRRLANLMSPASS